MLRQFHAQRQVTPPYSGFPKGVLLLSEKCAIVPPQNRRDRYFCNTEMGTAGFNLGY